MHNEKQDIRIKTPSHPGLFIRQEIIEPLGLTITKAAELLQVTRPALSALLNSRAQLSPEMALRIEKCFGVSMSTLLRMQSSYDIARIKKHADTIKVQKYHYTSGTTPQPFA